MKHPSLIHTAVKALCFGLGLAAISEYAEASDPKLAHYQAAEQLANTHIATFDTLDFDVFTNQKWDRLKESHSNDITVHWPDGHETKGIEKHIDDLKALFVFAPDLKIKVHPIRFGSGTWTAVTGVMSGTFTKPMPAPGGKSVAPTGKHFALSMATIGHWKGSTMDHKRMYWE